MSYREMSLLESADQNAPLHEHGGQVDMPRVHLVEIALFIIFGISMSIWLAVDPPEAAPARTSYLPAD
jgi:hypothetical protein